MSVINEELTEWETVMLELKKENEVSEDSPRGDRKESIVTDLPLLPTRRTSVLLKPRRQSTLLSAAPALGGNFRKMSIATRRQSIAPQVTKNRKYSLFSFNQQTYVGLPTSNPQVIEYENSYRLPEDEIHNKLKIHIVRQAAEHVIEDILDTCNYMEDRPDENLVARWQSKMTGSRLSLLVVREVKDKMKTLGMDRYKFVVNAIVGDVNRQGMRVASRCLWDENNDGSVTVTQKNNKHFVVCIIHAVYFE